MRYPSQKADRAAGTHKSRGTTDGGMRLSAREQDVVRLAAAGLSNKQIARMLIVRSLTIAAHMEHVREKIGVSSRTQIALSPGAWEPVNFLG